jgi:hypothetical protein
VAYGIGKTCPDLKEIVKKNPQLPTSAKPRILDKLLKTNNLRNENLLGIIFSLQ